MPNCEVFIVDEQGNDVGSGEVGELVIRGSNVMQGYWNAPELSAQVYRPGRYPGERLLYSGDLFRRDAEGFLYFVGRKGDMIKSRGERISPKEIEDILCRFDGVAEAAVIGVPDDLLGQAVKGFVVPLPGRTLSANEVLLYCKQNLESFMVPKYVRILEHLPRSPNGKLDKAKLNFGNMDNIEEQIRAFIVSQFLFGVEDGFSRTTRLFETNTVDSMGLVELTSFLQEKFRIRIEDEELKIENFSSLDRIAEFVRSKRDGDNHTTELEPRLEAFGTVSCKASRAARPGLERFACDCTAGAGWRSVNESGSATTALSRRLSRS